MADFIARIATALVEYRRKKARQRQAAAEAAQQGTAGPQQGAGGAGGAGGIGGAGDKGNHCQEPCGAHGEPHGLAPCGACHGQGDDHAGTAAGTHGRTGSAAAAAFQHGVAPYSHAGGLAQGPGLDGAAQQGAGGLAPAFYSDGGAGRSCGDQVGCSTAWPAGAGCSETLEHKNSSSSRALSVPLPSSPSPFEKRSFQQLLESLGDGGGGGGLRLSGPASEAGTGGARCAGARCIAPAAHRSKWLLAKDKASKIAKVRGLHWS